MNVPKTQSSTLDAKTRKHYFQRLQDLAEATSDNLNACLEAAYSSDAIWLGSHPLNELSGIEEIRSTAWGPLLSSFPNLERRDLIYIAGNYEGRDYVATVGHFCGTFRKNWLTIPANNKPIYIRYGEVHQVEDGKIIQSNCLWDILDLIRQAGYWPAQPSTGTEGRWAGPITGDGLQFDTTDPSVSAASLVQTLAMQKTLGDNNGPDHFNRDGLMNMDQKHYWHPKMMWYGPSGIGTTRGLDGFVNDHQLPFRLAFPNRLSGSLWATNEKLMKELKAGHYIRVGDGNYSVTGGWPSVVTPHDGPYLGVEPTGKLLQMRVMDFYAHNEGLIRENWVPIDIIHLLLQMGVDVFKRLEQCVEV